MNEWILLDEDEIAAAMRLVLQDRFAMVEGSAALPVAALAHLDPDLASIGLVLSGAGISREGLRVLSET